MRNQKFTSSIQKYIKKQMFTNKHLLKNLRNAIPTQNLVFLPTYIFCLYFAFANNSSKVQNNSS